jgi:hypothetical protein
VRRILLAGSAVFLISAVFLLLAPDLFAQWLGLATEDGTTWSLRMLGAVLVALAGQMFLVRRGSETTVRGAAVVMIVGGGLMTLLTFIVPAEWTLLRWAYLVFGLGFIAAYLIALARSRGQASNL